MKNLKPTLTIALVLIILSAFAIQDTTVYICKGPSSKKYHYKSNCRGLSNCSTKIYKVTKSEAKDMGRTLCGWED